MTEENQLVDVTEQDQPLDVDPVLERLHVWARGRTRAEVARELGVSRPAVAGWFIALEAKQKEEAVPASGRVFRYTEQAPHVQTVIAEKLNEPVEKLRAESLSYHGELSADEPDAAGELLNVARLVLGEMVSGRPPQPQSLAHRAAEVVESVTGAPTLIVPEPRGSDRAEPPYQYQLVVFYSGPSGLDSVQDREIALMEEITEGLKAAGLQVYWEHGVKTPAVELVYPGGPRWRRLGSLVIQHVAMSRASRVGLLVRPSPGNQSQRRLRHAAMVTAPYGGSDPVAGHLSTALGCGHIPAADVIRAVSDLLARRGHDDRRALMSHAALLDAGYSVQKVLYLLQAGTIPGAWIVSMEAALPKVFEPLAYDLVRFEGPLMLVRLGPRWQSMAAWRLAAATLNVEGRKDGAEPPWSCDQVDFSKPPTARDLEVLRHQFDVARQEDGRLTAWDKLMADMARQRREQGKSAGPTFEVFLDPLPDDVGAIRFDRGRWEPVSGAERFEGMVTFPDSVEGMMDAWVQAAVQLLDKLALLAGHEDASVLTGELNDGPVRRVIERRPAVGAS